MKEGKQVDKIIEDNNDIPITDTQDGLDNNTIVSDDVQVSDTMFGGEVSGEEMFGDNDNSESLQMTNDEVLNLIESFEKAKEENTSLKDDMLRAKADMENTKKRLIKHYEDQSKNKTKQLLLDIVTMLDDFERAMLVGNEGDSDGLIEGIKLIETQFIQTLENKWKVVRFDAKDVAFDPDKHEAMMSEEREDITEAVVLDEFSKGYYFEDKVLRSAKVKVGTPKQ